jgi:hypothetical protein
LKSSVPFVQLVVSHYIGAHAQAEINVSFELQAKLEVAAEGGAKLPQPYRDAALTVPCRRH